MKTKRRRKRRSGTFVETERPSPGTQGKMSERVSDRRPDRMSD
jgi:hypothetical protein